MNVAEAAKATGYSAWTIRKFARLNMIPGTREGRDWDFPEEAVREFRMARRIKGANKSMSTLLRKGIVQ